MHLKRKTGILTIEIASRYGVYESTLKKAVEREELEEVFEVIKALAEQIEEMKKGEIIHYERRLKGHLADLVNLKHELDYRETSEE